MSVSPSGAAPGVATALLGRVADGDEVAGRKLYDLLHAELHGPEANGNGSWHSRRHFFDVAAKAMRSVLVDHARRRNSQKRGEGRRPAPLQEVVDLYAERAFDLVELDDALERLAREDERLARVVELRFFAGLTIARTAEVLELSDATVERDWHVARTWLREELKGA